MPARVDALTASYPKTCSAAAGKVSLGSFPPHPPALPQRVAQCKVSVETALRARARGALFQRVRPGRHAVVLIQSSSGAPPPTSWRDFAPHKLALYWQNQRVALCSFCVNGNFRGLALPTAITRLQSRNTRRKPCAWHSKCVHLCRPKFCSTFNPDIASYTEPQKA